MSVERLSFENPLAKYNSYQAAEHISRYASVRSIVNGKRVLDVACGEGYGTRIMREWGAQSVVGVEISLEAVERARRMFGGDDISFIQGNAETLSELLTEHENFDVIVSFETIEHLGRPEDFLRCLPGLLASGGSIVISCPNDGAYPDHDNQFHVRTYTLTEFRQVTESCLGPASSWLLGAPILGVMNYSAGDEFVENSYVSQLSMTLLKEIANTVYLPAQDNLVTNEDSCAHYIGVWGASIDPNVALSTMSVPSYFEPWRTIDYFRERNAMLEAGSKDDTSAINERSEMLFRDLERLIDKCQREQLESRDNEILRLSALNRGLQAELSASATARSEVDGKLALAVQRQSELENLVVNELEPEISRLKLRSREATFEKEAQTLRNRLLIQSEQSQQIISFLRKQLEDNRELIDGWLRPEVERLNALVRNDHKLG